MEKKSKKQTKNKQKSFKGRTEIFAVRTWSRIRTLTVRAVIFGHDLVSYPCRHWWVLCERIAVWQWALPEHPRQLQLLLPQGLSIQLGDRHLWRWGACTSWQICCFLCHVKAKRSQEWRQIPEEKRESVMLLKSSHFCFNFSAF